LAEHVYDNDSDKDSNVIEVYVNRLRQKLGTELIENTLQTGSIGAVDKDFRRLQAVDLEALAVPPTAAPADALLDADSNALLDTDENFITEAA
jgi:hypothetical protein